jgi:hypothetical protein
MFPVPVGSVTRPVDDEVDRVDAELPRSVVAGFLAGDLTSAEGGGGQTQSVLNVVDPI